MAVIKDVLPRKPTAPIKAKPVKAPIKPVKPVIPAIPVQNVVRRPAPKAQATPWSPPQVAGAGGMNRPYLGSNMLPNALPQGRMPGTFQAPSPVRPPSMGDRIEALSNKWGDPNYPFVRPGNPQLPPPIPAQQSFDRLTGAMRDNPILDMWNWLRKVTGVKPGHPYTGQ